MWKLVTGAVISLLGGILLLDVKTTREHDAQIATLRAESANHASDLATLKKGREDEIDRLARIETNVANILKLLEGNRG